MILRKQVYIYLASYFINAGLSFGTVAVLTHKLNTYDYGVINLYSSFMIFLMPFISCGILYPLSVEYFKRPAETYSEYFTNAQALPLVSLPVLTLFCLLLQNPLAAYLHVSKVWIWILPLTVWWIMVNDTAQLISRNKNRPWIFAGMGIGKNLVEIALTLLFVVGLHMTWPGRLTSAVLAPALTGVICIFIFYRWRLLAGRIVWTESRRILMLSLPFVFERLAVFVLAYSDKFFIDRFAVNATREVGLYGLGSQLANIVSLVVVSMNTAYQPYLFKQLAGGLKKKIHRSTYWYIGASAGAVALMFLAIPLVFHFFIGPDFQAGRLFAYILSFSFLMWGVYNSFLAYLIYMEKNKIVLGISLAGIVVSLFLNLILVPLFGAIGAAITSVITYSAMAGICILVVRKHFLYHS